MCASRRVLGLPPRLPLSPAIRTLSRTTRSITRDDLVKYVETFYTAPRMVLVGTGGMSVSPHLLSAAVVCELVTSRLRLTPHPPFPIHL